MTASFTESRASASRNRLSASAALARELTKLHEDVRRGTLETLARETAAAAPRGEIVLVIAPPQAAERPSLSDTETMLREALKRGSLKDAVGEVADATGLPRREVYQRALTLAKEAKHGAPR